MKSSRFGFGKKAGITSLTNGAIGFNTSTKRTFGKAAQPDIFQTTYVTNTITVNSRSDDEKLMEKSVMQIFNQIIQKKNVGINKNRLILIRDDLARNIVNTSYYDPASESVFSSIILPKVDYLVT